MVTIHYREIICDGCDEMEILDSDYPLDLTQFAQICGQSPEWVLALLDNDILPMRASPELPQFIGEDVGRARRAYRLQRDFEASLPAVAVMLDLLDEVKQLRRQLRHPTPPDL